MYIVLQDDREDEKKKLGVKELRRTNRKKNKKNIYIHNKPPTVESGNDQLGLIPNTETSIFLVYAFPTDIYHNLVYAHVHDDSPSRPFKYTRIIYIIIIIRIECEKKYIAIIVIAVARIQYYYDIYSD